MSRMYSEIQNVNTKLIIRSFCLYFYHTDFVLIVIPIFQMDYILM